MMQEREPSRARKPTARRSAERSAQRERTEARFSSPGLIVRTRKMEAFVSGGETSCEMVADGADTWTLDAIGYMTSRSRAESPLSSSAFAQRGKQQNRQLTKRRRVTSTGSTSAIGKASTVERCSPCWTRRPVRCDFQTLDPYLGNIV